MPKGVKLPYSAYRANRATFQDFLRVPAEGEAGTLAVVLANPLHHQLDGDLDWALRRPGAEIHLLPRYTTQYWALLVAVAAGASAIPRSPGTAGGARADRGARGGAGVVCPLNSHFDFLDSLMKSGELLVAPPLLRAATSAASAAGIELVTPLLGSAPVGPTTVERLVAHCGTLPTVRFGSTETCLQGGHATGGARRRRRRPRRGAARLSAAGRTSGRACRRADIGRAHLPHTEVRVGSRRRLARKATSRRARGQPGQIVAARRQRDERQQR